MVENTGSFCLPHLKLRYKEGIYTARQYYPRLICCRHAHVPHQTLPGPGQGTTYSNPPTTGSPTDSPAHTSTSKPFSVHIEGSSVVSKIARPPPTSPQPCCPSLVGVRGGGASAGPGEERVVLQQVVVHQPTHTAPTGPWMLVPGGGCACRYGTSKHTSSTTSAGSSSHTNTNSNTDTDAPAPAPALTSPRPGCAVPAPEPCHNQQQQQHLLAEHSLTPGCSGNLDKYLEALDDGEPGNAPSGTAMKNEQQEEGRKGDGRCCPDPETILTHQAAAAIPSASSATSPPTDGGGTYPLVSKLSDDLDLSNDYTRMTDVAVTSTSAGALEDAGISVCSDVFSDGGITLDVECGEITSTQVPVGTSGDILSSEDNDLENDVSDLFANIRIDPPSPRASLCTSGEDEGEEQNSVDSDIDDDPNSPTAEEPICVLPSRGQGHSQPLGCEEGKGASCCKDDGTSSHATMLEVSKSNSQMKSSGKEKVPSVDLQTDAPVSGFYEDREFEFLNAPRIKRSTSLKTYKTPPGTPKRKMVRFADALGLDLESVRHILNQDGPPRIPMSATRDLDLPWDRHGGHVDAKMPAAQGARYLTACFQQPGINPTFPLMVRECKVLLESCVIHDYDLSVSGTVRVANIHFHKDVTIRYTTNNWMTHNDISAGYVHNSNDGPTDRFSFSISLPAYFSTGSRLQFCIRYTTGGQKFWDSNHGGNYRIECYARALPESDNCWTTFL